MTGANRKGAVISFLAKQYETAPRTIYHWLAAWKRGGLPALVTRDRADKGKPRSLNTAALDYLVAAAMPRKGSYGELTVREIYRGYNEELLWRQRNADKVLGEFERRKYARYLDPSGLRLAPSAQLPAASYETFRTWFNRIPELVKVMARDGGEAFANSQEIISFRNLTELKPLDYVVMDHRRLDLFCMVRSGDSWSLMRPWLTAAIDMRTRKWLAWAIVETPSSDSIASVIKRVILDHGVPAAMYWDNGKDFTCEWLEGRQSHSKSVPLGEMNSGVRGVMDTLGIRVHHAIVKRARSKIIEPNFLNTSHFDHSTPWWCGHKPTARPERFQALVDQHEKWIRGEAAESPFKTIEEIAWLYDEQLQALNEREHSGEGMRKITATGRGWMCPNECWERLIGSVERRTVAPEVLQFCFHRRREITIRHGEVCVTFAGRQYHYRLIGASIALMAFNGRQVEFSYDPYDLGTAALYHEGRFLGLVENVELRRMGESSFVADERDRRAARREVKKFIAAVHSTVHVPGVEERALRRLDTRPERPAAERTEAPAPLPPAVEQATAAAAADRDFSFTNAPDDGVQLMKSVAAAAYRDDDPDDGEFEFFQGDK